MLRFRTFVFSCVSSNPDNLTVSFPLTDKLSSLASFSMIRDLCAPSSNSMFASVCWNPELTCDTTVVSNTLVGLCKCRTVLVSFALC